MERRIGEKELLLPALYVIEQRGKANTTQIKNALEQAFQPTGEDGEILEGRNDTKFSQKVRNVMGSHYKDNRMDLYTEKDEQGFFTLTPEGEKEVEENRESLVCLFQNGFSFQEKQRLAGRISKARGTKRKVVLYSEDGLVSEGQVRVKNVATRQRSQELREKAIEAYTVNGRITCAACGFDFYKTYGERGKGYIQIHHEIPLYQYADDGKVSDLNEAVEHTKPLCANCHCMLHRDKAHLLTVEELKDILQKASP